MRALLGVLRAEGQERNPARSSRTPAWYPRRAWRTWSSLVERTAEAGVRVDVDVRGERRRLPAGLDLAAYRVIQEAITNVIKHAATDSCRVTVAYQQDALTLGGYRQRPRLGGPAAAARRPGTASIGMRERVGMYGGEFRAAPLPGSGFRVTAWFPLDGHRGMTIRVLVADDQALVRGSFRILRGHRARPDHGRRGGHRQPRPSSWPGARSPTSS